MDQDKLIGIVRDSIDSLAREEADYLLTDVSERSVCARLAQRMEVIAQGYMTGYYADVENNRKQAAMPKTIRNEEGNVIRVTCDLILHGRGDCTPDNIIAIEMTKAVRPAAKKERDRERLMALTSQRGLVGNFIPEHVCGYLLGAFIELNCQQGLFNIEYYEDGGRVGQNDVREIR